MGVLDEIHARARSGASRIVMSEGEDPRIVEGSLKAKADGLATPVLIGAKDVIAGLLRSHNAEGALEVIDPADSDLAAGYAEAFFELRKHKGMTQEKAAEAIQNPLVFAAMMVRQGDGDGTIGGAVNTTGDTLRAALQVIGAAKGVRTVSSFFLMILDQPHHPKQGVMAFADCGLIPDPEPAELAQIAASTADSFKAVAGEEARVAILSFSTMGSAKHPRVERVREAVWLAQEARPDLAIDGELQFDAAFVPEVAASKAPGSQHQGNANILVFPSLEAANIGYKIAQRIGGATAIGPILQGLAMPANDLSRGCSVEDIYHLIAVTALQAQSA